MKNILLFILLFLSSFSYGQIIVLDEDVTVNLPPTEDEVHVDVGIANIGSEDVEFWWDLERGNAPVEWEFKVCDLNLCYVWGVESCPCSKPNFFAAHDSAIMQIYINPNGVEGDAKINVNILTTCGRDSIYTDFPVMFVVDNTVSTQFEQAQDQLVIYPNPSATYFKIKNDKDIADIVVHNIIGKKMFARKHRPGMSHDISNLNNGIYLARLMDSNNNVVKVLRLTKE